MLNDKLGLTSSYHWSNPLLSLNYFPWNRPGAFIICVWFLFLLYEIVHIFYFSIGFMRNSVLGDCMCYMLITMAHDMFK